MLEPSITNLTGLGKTFVEPLHSQCPDPRSIYHHSQFLSDVRLTRIGRDPVLVRNNDRIIVPCKELRVDAGFSISSKRSRTFCG
jgi:hypothetical protein